LGLAPIHSARYRCPFLSVPPAAAADLLVVGAGPAALAIGAELAGRGLQVCALAPADPATPWPNTYGIWAEEVESLGLAHLLSHRWSDTVSHFGPGDTPLPHGRDYGLFDKAGLQRHWLDRAAAAGLTWQRGAARAVHHDNVHTTVTTAEGQLLRARLVVDASGHEAVFVRRPAEAALAGQAAYGIVGRFSAPPIRPGSFVFMDYRSEHLAEAERRQPPTFLYAMDLGDDVYFVEETSLALAPPVSFAVLRDRLHRRLAHGGVVVQEVLHEEFCLFPMNPPLPDLRQRVVGFGGAAAMVHPASGYLVGGLLRRAPDLAGAIAAGLERGLVGEALAQQAWQGLWTPALRWKHAFYRFGLEKLMRFEEPRLRHHFASFFSLPSDQWYGFLTNTLTPPELLAAMVGLYRRAPWDVRWGLMALQGREAKLLLPLLAGGG
jgi:lycopene cyclase-like protein